MSQQVAEALAALRGLGTVEEMQKLAAQGYAPAVLPRINGHFHLPPNFTALQNVRQVIDLAVQQGMGVLGPNNYYDYEVYGEFAQLARAKGIFPLFGMEVICMLEDLRTAGIKINDPANPGKFYLCGKGLTAFDTMTPEAQRLLGKIRKADSQRAAEMITRIEQVFAARGVPTGLTNDRVIDMVVRRHGCPRHTVYLQERHVAQAFQEAAFAAIPADQRIEKLNTVFGAATKAKGPDDFVTVQNDLRSYLMKVGKPGYVEETFGGFADAYQLIGELGGIACYPVLVDGAGATYCQFETPVDQLIENIKSRQIHAAEFIPNRNDPAVLLQYARALRGAGLIITAGTEHNTLDLIPLEPVCKANAAIPAELKALFWEGTCVIAAHQFLTLHGQIGYVDTKGRRNPAFKDADTAIAALAKLGAAVIRRYQDKTTTA